MNLPTEFLIKSATYCVKSFGGAFYLPLCNTNYFFKVILIAHSHAKLFLFSQNCLTFQRLPHDLVNQFQACLYLFECIFHGDFKYIHQIPECWYFWKLCDIFDLSFAHACRVESINRKTIYRISKLAPCKVSLSLSLITIINRKVHNDIYQMHLKLSWKHVFTQSPVITHPSSFNTQLFLKVGR